MAPTIQYTEVSWCAIIFHFLYLPLIQSFIVLYPYLHRETIVNWHGVWRLCIIRHGRDSFGDCHSLHGTGRATRRQWWWAAGQEEGWHWQQEPRWPTHTNHTNETCRHLIPNHPTVSTACMTWLRIFVCYIFTASNWHNCSYFTSVPPFPIISPGC